LDRNLPQMRICSITVVTLFAKCLAARAILFTGGQFPALLP
jgi:hypothetical protein